MYCSIGVTVRLLSVGAPGGSSGIPAAIQVRRIRYSSLLSAKRGPPSWPICPVALSKSKLASGFCVLTRRPSESRVRAARSKSTSCPRKESLKPPRPLRLPWHIPWLQPARESTAITSLRKLTGAWACNGVAARKKASVLYHWQEDFVMVGRVSRQERRIAQE